MFIEDGGEIEYEPYGGYLPDKRYIAVGWLEDVPIPKGAVPPPLVRTLVKLARSHRGYQTRGYHICTYCPDSNEELILPIEGERPLHLGSAEIWVPGEGNMVYCAPNLIIHYIRDHGYKPPQEFIDAVMQHADAP